MPQVTLAIRRAASAGGGYRLRTLENLIDNAGGWGEALTLAKFWVEHAIATKRPKARV